MCAVLFYNINKKCTPNVRNKANEYNGKKKYAYFVKF